MNAWLAALFSSDGFMPHGHCYLWTPELVWLHVVSDALIVLAYFTIPAALVWFLRKRPDVRFNWIFVCFATFILACGTTHLIEIWNVWHSDYWLAGGVKALTALASVPTAILLFRLVGPAAALPSAQALEHATTALRAEVAMRRSAQERLHEVNLELEARVAARTAELHAVNEQLRSQIADRHQTRAELHASNREVNDLKAALDEHAIVAITNPQGKITYVNDKFCAISQYSRDELLGQDHRLINSGFHSKEFIRELWQTIARGQVWNGEIRNRAKDGTFYWVATTIVPFLDDAGKPRQYVAIRADITERKRAEEKAAQLVAIVESSDEAIIGKGFDGMITSWNAGAERIFGYAAAEMIGQPILRLFPDDRSAEAAGILEKVERGETVRQLETLCRRADGTTFDVSLTASAIRDAAGKLIGAADVVRDITERKTAEKTINRLNAELEQRVLERTAQLEAANKELEAFSYSVSHDLRAPLRAVDGFSQAVLEDYGPQLPEEGQRYLETIRGSAQKMGTLIDDLLTFSRLSRAPLQKQPVNTMRLVRDILGDLCGGLAQRKVDLRVGDLPACEGDPALLRQVWINLISNALKYTGKRAEAVIEIGAQWDAGGVTYFVRDNGTGFDMRYAHKLFGVFQRLHRAEDYDGTGVGLAIVQRILHRHGGRIWAEAEVDRGATFYFTISEEPEP